MASLACKSALRLGSKSLATRSITLTQKFLTPSLRAISPTSRILSVLGNGESMMPLHSAVASARLTSCIAVDSSWSWVSRGLAKTL